MPHRTTVTFNDREWRIIETLSKDTGAPMSEILRRSLSVYRWTIEVRAQGGKILSERDGRIREMVGFD